MRKPGSGMRNAQAGPCRRLLYHSRIFRFISILWEGLSVFEIYRYRHQPVRERLRIFPLMRRHFERPGPTAPGVTFFENSSEGAADRHTTPTMLRQAKPRLAGNLWR